MTLPFGVFDIFGHAIPGAMYLGVGVYSADRLKLAQVARLSELNTAWGLIVFGLASYFIGLLLGNSSRLVLNRLPFWRKGDDEARAEFEARNPELADQPYLRADPFTIVAGLREASPGTAIEVDRLRACGFMLLHASPPMAIAAVAAGIETIVGARPLASLSILVFLVLGSALSIYQGRRFEYWALVNTYESAVWLPDVEQKLGRGSSHAS